MYHVSAQGVDEHMINVHYYYCYNNIHSYCSVRSFILFYFLCLLVTVVLDFLLLYFILFFMFVTEC